MNWRNQICMTIYTEIRNRADLDKKITLGESTESEFIEFKREINFQDPKIHNEFALDICQFMNSLGGVILIGAVETLCALQTKKVVSSYVNANFERTSQFIYDKVLSNIHPNPSKLDICSIPINDNVSVIAINIPPVTPGIACVAENRPPYRSKFPYRTGYGKKYFSPSEVEKMLSNSNRHIAINLHKNFPLTKEIRLIPSVEKESVDSNVQWDVSCITCVLKEIMENEYTINVAGVNVNIPFSLTKDVWVTEDDKIGILLSMKLVISSDRKKINFNF